MSMDPADWALQGGLGLAELLARYHRHRVNHLERLESLFDRGRRVILIGNHALDIVDPALLLAAVYRRTGRLPRFIGHENGWFKLPLIRDFSRHFQVIPSRRFEETVEAVRRDGFLMLYPGGVRESGMRSYRDEPYRLTWEGRTGFLRLALEAEADLVFVATVGNDEAYYQSRLPTPRALLRLLNGGDDERYGRMRLRFGAAGVHLVPGVLPLPVRINHVLSPALDLGDREHARRDAQAFENLHTRIRRECQVLLDDAVARREEDSDLLDRGIRAGQSVLQRLGW
jgi:1-acyl-sn-glycerol-3-phosphate acyltransferase